MTFAQLEAFVMVAELRGFTAAAIRLGISQSAVSHAIGSLEQELGVSLFRRQKSAIELSDIGSRLLLRAREMLGLSETMRQEAADACGLKKGTLRIGSFGPTSSLRLLPLLLDEYRKDYPDIEVHIEEGPDQDVMQWLLDRRIDLGFVVLPEERFDTLAITEDQMVAVLPANHALAARRSVRLDELCSDPFIMTEAGSAHIVMRLFEAAQLRPKIRYRNSQVMTTVAMISRGEGVAILAELALPPAELCPGIAFVSKPLDPPVRRSIGIATHSTRQASPAARAFIDRVRQIKRRGKPLPVG